MRAQMQKLMGMVQGQEALAGMGDLIDSLKAEEKVTMSLARRIFLENFVISELLCASFRHLLAPRGGREGITRLSRGTWTQC